MSELHPVCAVIVLGIFIGFIYVGASFYPIDHEEGIEGLYERGKKEQAEADKYFPF